MANLKPLSDSALKLDFESNLSLARSLRARIAANPLIDRMLESSNGANPFGAGPILALPAVAYSKPDSPPGTAIEYVARPYRYLLDIRDFKKEKGIALAFEEFQLVPDGLWRIVLPKTVIPVGNFPQDSSWCGIDERTGVPTLSDLSKKRFAFRHSGPWIGPMIRDYGFEGRAKSDIYLHHRPSFKAVALVEAHAAAVVIPFPKKDTG